jgi:hypothetical protein
VSGQAWAAHGMCHRAWGASGAGVSGGGGGVGGSAGAGAAVRAGEGGAAGADVPDRGGKPGVHPGTHNTVSAVRGCGGKVAGLQPCKWADGRSASADGLR